MKFPGRILVADHSGNLDRFVCRVLGQDKWYIASADNVFDLEKAVYSQVPHILVINSHMPNLRVKAFIDQIKAHYGDNRPHIILAVVKDVERRLKKGFAAGADDFLRVPFHAVELAAKINCAMRAVHLRYEYQRAVDEFNDQLAAIAPQLFETHQPVSSSELQGEVLASPPPTDQATGRKLEEPKREFPDPEHDMEPTAVVASVEPEELRLPPTPAAQIAQDDIQAEEHYTQTLPPAPPENVIPMFTPVQMDHGGEDYEFDEDKTPITNVAALDMGLGGRPVKKEHRHRRSRIPQIRLKLPEQPIEQEDGSSRRKMTLMLVKINGFGTVCEDLEAGTSARVINNVYKELVKEISRFGGKAINIQGDSLLATFNSSRQHQNHRMSAMQAALQLQIKAMFLDEKFPELVGQISLSIAIHTGMVTVANVGSSSGDTSVVGSSVTVVLRMLNQCDDSQIMVSQATFGSFRASVLLNDEKTVEIGRQQQPLAIATLSGMNARDLAMVGNMSFG